MHVHECIRIIIILVMVSKLFNNSGYTFLNFITPCLGSLHLRGFDFNRHDSN